MNRFFANTIHLDSPVAADSEAAYYSLPAEGRALVACRSTEMAAVLASLEGVGFFGMRIRMPAAAGGAVLISAFKGKAGVCYDTGKSASYKGSAASALDDDNHLLFGETRICEKTAAIYSSPVYADIVDVSAGDPALVAKLKEAPVAFDCDTFDADVEKLVAALVREQGERGCSLPILYPGPFKLLVLPDGTILRRGEVTLLDGKRVQRLAAEDGCITLEEKHAVGVPPANLIDAYYAKGAICLLGDMQLQSTFRHSEDVTMAALQHAPESTVVRLKKMIERDDSYFILTGSDPRDEFGCCPSGEVGACNRLVEAGLLDCWHPPASAQSCASTVYAFRGEMSMEGQEPSFAVNGEFRRKVMNYLGETRTRKWTFTAAVIRWALLIFAVISIGVVLFGGIREDIAIGDGPFAREIALARGNVLVVCYFYREEMCDWCGKMETFTKKALALHFGDEVRSHRISFRDVNMDLPENRELTEQYDVFTSSIVLVLIRDGKVERSKLLENAWHHAGFMGSEEEFLKMMQTELARLAEDVE